MNQASILMGLVTFLQFLLTSLSGSAQGIPALKKLAYKLHDVEIVGSTNYEPLLTAIRNGEVKTEFDCLKYCDRAGIIDLDMYGDEPESYLEQIHQDVAEILPSLEFTDFGFEVVLDTNGLSDADHQFYDFRIRMNHNGRTYWHQSLWRLNDNRRSKISEQDFYGIFNKMLVDDTSQYRLHLVNESNIHPHPRFGILALTKEQAGMLHHLSSNEAQLRVSYEAYSYTISSSRIEEAISEYQSVGMFKHLTDAQIKSGTESALRERRIDLNHVLSWFSDVLFWFDSELDNLNDPYRELLEEMAKVSHGVFNPTNIRDDFRQVIKRWSEEKGSDDLKVNVSFDLNDKHYATELRFRSDWADARIFTFVNQVAEENDIEGRFYTDLFTDGQDVMMIFLTDKQRSYLRAHRLIVLWSDTDMDDEW